MTHWHYAMLETVPEDRMVRPMICPDRQTREQAHAEILGLLRRDPATRPLAEIWARGAKDDVVFLGPFRFGIFECGQTCAEGQQAYLDDYAATLRDAGMRDVSVAQVIEIH